MHNKNFADLRNFFPIFKSCNRDRDNANTPMREESFIWLDNAATTQKPQQVIDRIIQYYACENASVHRGLYVKAEQATYLYEQAREGVAHFIGAQSDEIIFTKGATEAINFIAATWAQNNLSKDDEIIISELEHNANVLPWLNLSETLGIKIKYIPIDAFGNLDYEAYLNLINDKTRLVSITHRANSIGVKVDLNLIIKKAHENNIPVLVDAAQTIAHEKIDVSVLKPDFMVFSAHKMLGPTGIGALYISRAMQEYTPPYQLGGGMVQFFDSQNRVWLKSPQKYEAGSPQIAQALGFAEAIKFLKKYIEFEALHEHQKLLSSALIAGLQNFKNIKIIGPISQLIDSPIISFYSDKFHSHDIAAYLAQFNIAVRAGNHCAQMIYKKLNIPGSLRISTYFYNTIDEIDFVLSKLGNLLGE